MKKVYRLENLDCADCASKMERAVEKLDGVKAVSFSFLMQKMTIEAETDRWDELMDEAQRVCKKVEPDCVILR